MIRRFGTLLLAWLCLAGIAPAMAAPVRAEQESAAGRQILVLLRLAPEHHRSGSDYGDDLARGARERMARRIARKHGLAVVDGWPMPVLGLDCYIMSVPDGRTVNDAVADVAKDAAVSWAEPMQVYHALGARPAYNDPLLAAQPATAQWRIADLHRYATGRGVKVAVIDSDIDAHHPDLAGQVIANENFVDDRPAVPEAHGTGVAGIIAARADNGQGIVGVAPDAKLIGLRACWQLPGQTAICNSLSLAKALHAAIEKKAQVINLSLSGPPGVLLGRLLDMSLMHGAVVVAAFDPSLPKGGFPASQPGVIAVSDETLTAAVSGVYVAPGRDVPTTEPGGRWDLVNGSSYAAAHVSGLVALLLERREAAALVASRADGGVIDACASLLRTAKSCDLASRLGR